MTLLSSAGAILESILMLATWSILIYFEITAGNTATQQFPIGFYADSRKINKLELIWNDHAIGKIRIDPFAIVLQCSLKLEISWKLIFRCWLVTVSFNTKYSCHDVNGWIFFHSFREENVGKEFHVEENHFSTNTAVSILFLKSLERICCITFIPFTIYFTKA